MGYLEDAEPVIKYHDLDGPLQEQFYRDLGEFLTLYTGAEEDIVYDIRSFLSAACGAGMGSQSVIHILTAAAPVGYMMDTAAIVAEEVRSFSKPELDRMRATRERFDEIRKLRNLLCHQPAMLSPYTEMPFAVQVQAGEQRIKNFKTIFIGVDTLGAAISDTGLAGYHYRLALSRAEVPAGKEPTWRYKPSLLTHRHHQKR